MSISYMTGARMKLDLIFQNLGITNALKITLKISQNTYIKTFNEVPKMQEI